MGKKDVLMTDTEKELLIRLIKEEMWREFDTMIKRSKIYHTEKFDFDYLKDMYYFCTNHNILCSLFSITNIKSIKNKDITDYCNSTVTLLNNRENNNYLKLLNILYEVVENVINNNADITCDTALSVIKNLFGVAASNHATSSTESDVCTIIANIINNRRVIDTSKTSLIVDTISNIFASTIVDSANKFVYTRDIISKIMYFNSIVDICKIVDIIKNYSYEKESIHNFDIDGIKNQIYNMLFNRVINDSTIDYYDMVITLSKIPFHKECKDDNLLTTMSI